jgi:hypothetical protein
LAQALHISSLHRRNNDFADWPQAAGFISFWCSAKVMPTKTRFNKPALRLKGQIDGGVNEK